MKKHQGIKANKDSITIKIPLGDEKYARETQKLEPTASNLQCCANLRRDFIKAWDDWKKTKIGPFNYNQFFPNSNNRQHYLIGGGDQLTIEDRLRNHYNFLKEENTLAASTLHSAIGEINMLNKYFGDKHISELTHKHIQDMIDDSEVTRKTINHRLNHLRKIMYTAMTEGVITSNLLVGWVPVHKAKNQSTYKKDAYTNDEVNLILHEAKNYPEFYSMLLFRCTMGMRTGEVYGLKWKYVNELHNQIQVMETMVNGTLKETPKTSAGIRKIRLNSYSLAAIDAQRCRTNDPDAFVFQNPNAISNTKAWAQKAFDRRWNKIIANTGLRRLRPYALRHSFATLLWGSGEITIEDLSELLGHADIETTRKIYIVDRPKEIGVSTSAIDGILDSDLLNMPGD